MFYSDQLLKDNLSTFSGDKFILVCPKCGELFAERDPKTIQNLDQPTFMREIRHKCKGTEMPLEEMRIDEYLAKYKFSEKP